MNINHFKTWTALITPFLSQKNEIIDYDSLELMLLKQDEAQNGVLLLGSTGEALNLSLETKRKIIEHVLSMKKKHQFKIPLMLGVGGHLLNDQINWIKEHNDLPIDAFLLVTPLYAKPGDKGQYLWFKSLLDVSEKPCVLYNVPGRTGSSLSLSAISSLIHHPQFWAIKEASGSVDDFKQYKNLIKSQKIFCGDDALFRTFANEKSDGLISVVSNAWPHEAHFYVENCINEKGLPENIHHIWQSSSQALFTSSNPIPIKFLLFHQKIIQSSEVILPLSQNDFTEDEKENLIKLSDQLKNSFEKDITH